MRLQTSDSWPGGLPACLPHTPLPARWLLCRDETRQRATTQQRAEAINDKLGKKRRQQNLLRSRDGPSNRRHLILYNGMCSPATPHTASPSSNLQTGIQPTCANWAGEEIDDDTPKGPGRETGGRTATRVSAVLSRATDSLSAHIPLLLGYIVATSQPAAGISSLPPPPPARLGQLPPRARPRHSIYAENTRVCGCDGSGPAGIMCVRGK